MFQLDCHSVSGVDGLYQNLAKVVECHRDNSVCVQNICLAAMAFTGVCTEHTLLPLQLPVSVHNIIVVAISLTIVCAEHVCSPLWLSVHVDRLSCNIAVYFFLDKASPLCFKYPSK